jgi:hypothetical protein
VRLNFELVGTVCTPISVDPAEYLGMTVPQATAEILKTAKEINPTANYFLDDAVLAANQVVSVAAGEDVGPSREEAEAAERASYFGADRLPDASD